MKYIQTLKEEAQKIGLDDSIIKEEDFQDIKFPLGVTQFIGEMRKLFQGDEDTNKISQLVPILKRKRVIQVVENIGENNSNQLGGKRKSKRNRNSHKKKRKSKRKSRKSLKSKKTKKRRR